MHSMISLRTERLEVSSCLRVALRPVAVVRATVAPRPWNAAACAAARRLPAAFAGYPATNGWQAISANAAKKSANTMTHKRRPLSRCGPQPG